jgi:hypothetical protein
MKKVERSFMIDEDAATLLVQLAGGPRKQGEFLSDLIREKSRQDPLLTRIADLERELAQLRVEVLRREQRDGLDGGEGQESNG